MALRLIFIYTHNSTILRNIQYMTNGEVLIQCLPFSIFMIKENRRRMYITLSDIKAHLNLDADYTADDQYLLTLIQVAEDAIAKRIDRKLSHCVQPDGMLPPTIIHAIKLLVGTWYANRETFVTTSANELPQGFEFLANLNKRYEMF